MKKVALIGASGKMGTRTQEKLSSHPRLELGGAIYSTSTEEEVLEIFSRCDVALDWSAPAALSRYSEFLEKAKLPYVVGSTGLEAEHRQVLKDLAEIIPVLPAANFSIGVNVAAQLSKALAQLLGSSADYEIFELHHGRKKDAPSGTARLLGKMLIEGSEDKLDERFDRMTEEGPRKPEQLGYAALRGGDVAGEHTVFALLDGERIEITHRATSAMIFAEGALKACEWLIGQKPGTYAMSDVL